MHLSIRKGLVVLGILSCIHPASAQIQWRSAPTDTSITTRAEGIEILANPALRNYAKHVVVRFDQPLTLDICPGFVSDAGMYDDMNRDFGFEAPKAVGTTSPQKVASAVIRAVKRDLPEIIVNPTALRPMLALGALFPRFVLWLTIRLGLAQVFAPLAKLRTNSKSD